MTDRETEQSRPSLGRRRVVVQLMSLVVVAALPATETAKEFSFRGRRRIGYFRRRLSRRRRCSYHGRHC